MLKYYSLEDLLFFDLETTATTETLSDLEKENPDLARVFRDYFNSNVLCRRFPDADCTDAETLYREIGGLIPEFSRIVSAAVGFEKDGEWRQVDFTSRDERFILTRLDHLFTKVGRDLCAFNGATFDVPLLARKFVQHKLPYNKMFPQKDTKPWEIRVVDPKAIWQMGSRTELAKLELICAFLGIESPKDGDVSGSGVHDLFWSNDPTALKKIGEYCLRDVIALREIVKRLIGE